ncbi:MAG: hypothetical protein SNH63_05265 [Rikenellaceae bacterium]
MKKNPKIKNSITTIIAAICLCICILAHGAKSTTKTPQNITVSSLEELMPHLKHNNVTVAMTPGTYRVTAEDMRNGRFPSESEVEEGRLKKVLLLFEGNNSYYDLTGVVLEIEAEVFTKLDNKYREFINIQTLGNNNVIKGIKLVDIANMTDGPNRGYVNVILDGASNRLEEVEINSIGSFPYGYGELFGKGGKNVINHRKHSACLVRGYKNHVLNCKIIHNSFGHCLFMQAADEPLIEGCYIQSFMTTTDSILAEKGGDAERVGYLSYFGYQIPSGYTIAVSEEGIRAYNGGETMIDGVRYKRGASNVTIKDCYVKNVRAGVTLTHATGRKYVENTTVIGCERGFCVGTGQIVNCQADCQYGPALGVDYGHDRGTIADITILPNADQARSGNGSKHAAIIIGNNHKITLRRGAGLCLTDQELTINIGGDNRTIGLLSKDQNYPASDIEIVNETGYPIVIDDNASRIVGKTTGAVVDNGDNNKIEQM